MKEGFEDRFTKYVSQNKDYDSPVVSTSPKGTKSPFSSTRITLETYSLMISLASKVHPLICCLIAGIITGGIGIIIERTAYRPVRNANRMVPMISAFGVALILKTVAQVIWGPEAIPFESLLPSGSFMVGGMQIYIRAIIIPLCSLAVVVIMQFVLQKTKMGLGTRDIMQDIQTSSLMGIPTNTIIPGIYALGGFLGVFGGVLYCSYYSYISIDMGMLGTIKAWAVVMLGGVGSFWGAFFGGIILGIAEAMAGAYVGTAFRDAINVPNTYKSPCAKFTRYRRPYTILYPIAIMA